MHRERQNKAKSDIVKIIKEKDHFLWAFSYNLSAPQLFLLPLKPRLAFFQECLHTFTMVGR